MSILDVCFTLLSKFKTSEYKHFSTKKGRFFIAVSYHLVITGFAWKVSIIQQQQLSGTLFYFHFWSMMLSFCKTHLKGCNLTVERNFVQIGEPSFQIIIINTNHNKTKSFVLYTTCFWCVYFYVFQSFSFLITDIIFNSSIVSRIEYKFFKSL